MINTINNQYVTFRQNISRKNNENIIKDDVTKTSSTTEFGNLKLFLLHSTDSLKSKIERKHRDNKSAGTVDLEEGQILDENSNLINLGFTTFCRADLDWQDFGKYLQENFQNIEDADIYCFGCSTGEEPYSLAMLLKSRFGDNPFKIKASDIIEDRIKRNIENQKKGVLINDLMFEQIYDGLGIKANEAKNFFTSSEQGFLQLSKNIVNSVEFKKENILKSVDKFSRKRKSIILCRNMWPYISADKYQEFAKKLYGKLAPGSIVVVGDFDYVGTPNLPNVTKFPIILELNNFKPVKDRGIGWNCSSGKDSGLIFKKEEELQ
ncbi:hypothetical protein II906_06255 [bacterium]|nr:hypothetical protein [bacterium]